jgi:hypothetical protein
MRARKGNEVKTHILMLDGVRTYATTIASAQLARDIVRAVETRKSLDQWDEETGCLFSEIVRKLRNDNAGGLGVMKAPASYSAVLRALPFEHGGMVYRLESGGEQRMVYQPTKRLIRSPGKLEDVKPPHVPRKAVSDRIHEAVVEAVAKVAPVSGDAAPSADLIRVRDSLEAQIADLWKALEGRGAAQGDSSGLADRLAALESQVADLAIVRSIYGLREEARKYMDGRFGAFDDRLNRLEGKPPRAPTAEEKQSHEKTMAAIDAYNARARAEMEREKALGAARRGDLREEDLY